VSSPPTAMMPPKRAIVFLRTHQATPAMAATIATPSKANIVCIPSGPDWSTVMPIGKSMYRKKYVKTEPALTNR
ncbi:hypothetical protein ABTH66_19425, partial [Acinetobacter baumannii]